MKGKRDKSKCIGNLECSHKMTKEQTDKEFNIPVEWMYSTYFYLDKRRILEYRRMTSVRSDIVVICVQVLRISDDFFWQIS